MYRVTQLWVSTLINKQPDCSRSSGALCDHLAHLQAVLRPQQQLVFGFQLSRQQTAGRGHVTCRMCLKISNTQKATSATAYCFPLILRESHYYGFLLVSKRIIHGSLLAMCLNKLSPSITTTQLCWSVLCRTKPD